MPHRMYRQPKNIDRTGLHNAQTISYRLKRLLKEKSLTRVRLAELTKYSEQTIKNALGPAPKKMSYAVASRIADIFQYDLDKLYDEALKPSIELDANSKESYTLYFAGYDIAMCVRLLKLLEVKTLLPKIDVEVHGQQNQQKITIKNKVVGSHSNGHIQCFYMHVNDDFLSIGGPLSCIEGEDIRSDEILIFLPKIVYWEIRDDVFALYRNKDIDITLEPSLIVKGSSRYLLTLLKKHKNNQKSLQFLINYASELIDNDHDYSALAECFKFFAIKKNCLGLSYINAFKILQKLFNQCLANENYKDAEYTLSAMGAIVQNNNCSRLDFINLSESIIDNNLNIENKNNFNLIILTTLKTTNFDTQLDIESKQKIKDIEDSISDFVKSEYRKIYLI
jgi:transcriptional regulator with XRE-family HTH domain